MNDSNITKLTLIDKYGNPADKKYRLKNGENIFRCLATFTDGSNALYSPYWTCPILLNNSVAGQIDVWGVFGNQKRESVTINASPQHTRYTELACWVLPPKQVTPTGNAEIPHDSIGFDYQNIE